MWRVKPPPPRQPTRGSLALVGPSLYYVAPPGGARGSGWARGMNKSDIINLLGRKHGFSSYLEICTPTTGWRYAQIDRRQYRARCRLMYRCRPGASHTGGIDYPVFGDSADSALTELYQANRRFDAVLVDPWHSYGSSIRDMELAFQLLSEQGVMVVHDCSPPSPRSADPSYRPGQWCGETYAAFIDFTEGRPDIEFYTVDTDFGCAVVRRQPSAAAPPIVDAPGREARARWQDLEGGQESRFRFFDSRREDLLNLSSVETFLAREGLATISWRSAGFRWIRYRCRIGRGRRRGPGLSRSGSHHETARAP
jgi:hypothetical protein